MAHSLPPSLLTVRRLYRKYIYLSDHKPLVRSRTGVRILSGLYVFQTFASIKFGMANFPFSVIINYQYKGKRNYLCRRSGQSVIRPRHFAKQHAAYL